MIFYLDTMTLKSGRAQDMKIVITIACALVAHSIYADSAITRYATGPGFNTYRDYMELTIPGGKWTGRTPGAILITDFPQGVAFDAQLKAYDAKIGGKWGALNNELRTTAQKDPLYSQTLSKIADIDQKVAQEMAKQKRSPGDLLNAYQQRQRDYVEVYTKTANAQQQLLKTFKDAWAAYEKACLAPFKAQRRSGEKDKPVLDALKARGMQLQPADTVFLIGERFNLNVGPFDTDQIPAEIVKVVGKNIPVPAKFTKYLLNPSTDPKCEPLRQAAAKAYAQLDEEIQKNPDIVTKNSALQKALSDLNAVQNQTTVNDKLLRRVLERELGLDFQLMAMNQIVSRAAAALRPKVQELLKGIPADLINAQKAFDPVADKAIDALDADIQKVSAQRRQAKITK